MYEETNCLIKGPPAPAHNSFHQEYAKQRIQLQHRFDKRLFFMAMYGNRTAELTVLPGIFAADMGGEL